MNNNNFPEKEIEFFGKITASVSHELNNVLSIINEYSGLLGDLLAACGENKPVEAEKIISITKNIGEQTKREKEIINLLNRFSHNVDSPVANFTLNELLSDIIRLTKRFASLKRIELRLSLCPQEIRMISNPFRIQHAVFLLLSVLIDSYTDAAFIETVLEKTEVEAVIQISVPAESVQSINEQKLECIGSIVNSIKGSFKKAVPSENKILYKVILPLSSESY